MPPSARTTENRSAHLRLLPSSLLAARVVCRLSRRFRAVVLLLDPLPKKALLPPPQHPPPPPLFSLPKVPPPRKPEFWLNAADMPPPADDDNEDDDHGHEGGGGRAPRDSAVAAAAAPEMNAPLQQGAARCPPCSCREAPRHGPTLRVPAADADSGALSMLPGMPSGKTCRKAPLEW